MEKEEEIVIIPGGMDPVMVNLHGNEYLSSDEY